MTHQLNVLDFHYGSWLCKNAVSAALTAGDLSKVGALSRFREFDAFGAVITPTDQGLVRGELCEPLMQFPQ